MGPNYPDGVTVRIGPLTWTIGVGDDALWEMVGQDETKHYGYTSNTHGLILINRASTMSMRRVVVFHELLHAAYFSSGGLYDGKLREEEWVLRVAPMALHALQTSDAELVAWLLDRDGEA
jgi:hypothetical protein